MIEVQDGQHCVVQRMGRFSVVKADKVTPKQIHTTRSWGTDRQSRHDIVFAGTGAEAGKLVAALNRSLDERDEKLRASRQEFEAETAPAVERREERERTIRNSSRTEQLQLLDNAKADGEVPAAQEG